MNITGNEANHNPIILECKCGLKYYDALPKYCICYIKHLKEKQRFLYEFWKSDEPL